MLHKVTQLKGATVKGFDGEIGVVDDVLLDDEQLRVRYLAVKASRWPHERKVLIAPESIRRESSSDRFLEVDLTCEEALDGPIFDLDKPLSRRQEMAYAAYHGIQPYWHMPPLPTSRLTAPDMVAGISNEQTLPHTRTPERHIFSGRDMFDCAMATPDGDVGKIEDLLIDDESWQVRELIVDTTRWLPGGEISVPTSLIHAFDTANRRVEVHADRATLDKLSTRH